MTPTLRSSPFFAAYEPRTEPKRNAATSASLRRNPSISTNPCGATRYPRLSGLPGRPSMTSRPSTVTTASNRTDEWLRTTMT